MGLLLDLFASKAQNKAQRKVDKRMNKIKKEVAALDPLQELEQFKVESPNIRLSKGEICYYAGEVHPFKLKQRYARSSSSKGISVKIMNGLWYHTGGGQSSPIVQEYCDSCDGTLFITNQRWVLTAPKYGFNIKIQKIINLEIHDNGFSLYEGNRCHMVNGIGGESLYRLIQLMNAADKIRVEQEEKEEAKQITKNSAKNKHSPDKFDEIREYKKLLDDGIITQDEFEKKRTELLSL